MSHQLLPCVSARFTDSEVGSNAGSRSISKIVVTLTGILSTRDHCKVSRALHLALGYGYFVAGILFSKVENMEVLSLCWIKGFHGAGGPPGRPAKNGKACAAMPPKPPSVDLSYIMNLNSKLNYTGWYNAVKNRGIWDFKQIRNLDDFGVPLKQSQYGDFGNWNFGLTAAQQGIPRQIALRGAGWAGQRAIGKSFLSALGTALGSAPYGDDSADQKQINAGYDYYVSHCY